MCCSSACFNIYYTCIQYINNLLYDAYKSYAARARVRIIATVCAALFLHQPPHPAFICAPVRGATSQKYYVIFIDFFHTLDFRGDAPIRGLAGCVFDVFCCCCVVCCCFERVLLPSPLLFRVWVRARVCANLINWLVCECVCVCVRLFNVSWLKRIESHRVWSV